MPHQTDRTRHPHHPPLHVRRTARGGVEHLSPRFEYVKRLRQEGRKRAGHEAREEGDGDRSEIEGGG